MTLPEYIPLKIIYLATCIVLVADTPPESILISPLEMVVASTLLSMIGGLGWATRSQREEPITRVLIISTVLNMGTVGASGSMIVFAFFSKVAYVELMVIGGIGILSLGGMPIIEWVLKLAKKRVEKESGSDT